ncbi:MAG TPA: hypothetical protein VI306_16590 [Pyrinomonadaceae bacterium]
MADNQMSNAKQDVAGQENKEAAQSPGRNPQEQAVNERSSAGNTSRRSDGELDNDARNGRQGDDDIQRR